MGHLFLALALIGWGGLHSVLAADATKERVRKLIGDRKMGLYRLTYNAVAVMTFLPILWLLFSLPDRIVYSVTGAMRGLLFAGQASAAVLLLASLLQTDARAFMGLPPDRTSSAKIQLVTSGSYRYVRHPLYALGLLILWLYPVVSQNSLMINIFLTAYVLVGIQLEERRLMSEFGTEYEAYRRRTGMLIPHVRFRLH